MADDRACSPTLIKRGPLGGGLEYAIYSFTNDADDTGGTIVSGFKYVLAAFAQNETTAAKGVKLERNTDESGSDNGDVKLTVNAGDDGTVLIIGYGHGPTMD